MTDSTTGWKKALAAGMAMLASASAWAALGGDASSVPEDARSLGTQERVSQREQYALHELSQGLVQVHEYSAANGKVFALAWRGQKHPDLQQLLGSHLSDFQKALGQARKTRRHGGSISITLNQLHLEMGGHMGSIYGRVWLTDQLPAGMDLNEIK